MVEDGSAAQSADGGPLGPLFSSPEQTGSDGETMIQALRQELQLVLTEHGWLEDHIDPDRCHVYIAGWKRRRGLCSYNVAVSRTEFGARVDSGAFSSATNNYSLGVARRLWEDDNNWVGTLRHEVAHAYLYAKHGESQQHNERFRRVNRRLGGTERSMHVRENYEYAIACPNGCFTGGRIRRCKSVKEPFNRRCKECKENIVSYDWGAEQPDEPGLCAVESIPWSTFSEWDDHPTGRLT